MAETGRPTVITDEVLQKLELAWMAGFSDEEACYFAGIAPRSLYYYQKDNDEFLQKKLTMKNHLTMRAKMAIARKMSPEIARTITSEEATFMANNPDYFQVIQWWADRKLPEFSQKIKATVSKEEEAQESIEQLNTLVNELRKISEPVQTGREDSTTEQGAS